MDKAMLVFPTEHAQKRALVEEVLVKEFYDPFVAKFTTEDGRSVHVYEKQFLRNLDDGDVSYRLVGLDELGMQMDPMTYSRLEDALGINTTNVSDERLDTFFER